MPPVALNRSGGNRPVAALALGPGEPLRSGQPPYVCRRHTGHAGRLGGTHHPFTGENPRRRTCASAPSSQQRHQVRVLGRQRQIAIPLLEHVQADISDLRQQHTYRAELANVKLIALALAHAATPAIRWGLLAWQHKAYSVRARFPASDIRTRSSSPPRTHQRRRVTPRQLSQPGSKERRGRQHLPRLLQRHNRRSAQHHVIPGEPLHPVSSASQEVTRPLRHPRHPPPQPTAQAAPAPPTAPNQASAAPPKPAQPSPSTAASNPAHPATSPPTHPNASPAPQANSNPPAPA